MPKGRKKTPPQRIPCSKADVEKAERKATDYAATFVWAVCFSVMRDKFGWGPVRLMRLWDEVIKMADSIAQGYVKVEDLERALEDEAGIVLREFKIDN